MDDFESTFPRGVDITPLLEGYELARAAMAAQRAAALEPNPQKKALLGLAKLLLVTRRNQRFDDFANSWLKMRSQGE